MAEEAAMKVQERLKQLRSLVRDIDKKMAKNETTLKQISETHDLCYQEGKISAANEVSFVSTGSRLFAVGQKRTKIRSRALGRVFDSGKFSPLQVLYIGNWHRMRLGFCSQARITGCKEVMRKSAYMKMLKSSAHTLPLWVGKPGQKPAALVGAIPADPSHIANRGDMVAALVRNVEDNEDNWILAEVVNYNASTRTYEVIDIDDVQKGPHQLSRKQIIPLPTKRANPETEPEALFPIGSVGESLLIACILNATRRYHCDILQSSLW
ncbi:SAGA-associated factor 29-like [Diaphorina citri]|uniref:SAGA-associated factor 29-like n=1 Tax=Diaphorina citri TaxID=121845 RepID=A0A3Q0IQH3_DIACI|nr:SAGA-associated factor 29-like [Diaphorina citri]